VKPALANVLKAAAFAEWLTPSALTTAALKIISAALGISHSS
jgi:hypothetical protein